MTTKQELETEAVLLSQIHAFIKTIEEPKAKAIIESALSSALEFLDFREDVGGYKNLAPYKFKVYRFQVVGALQNVVNIIKGQS